MRFAHTEKASIHRQVIRKVQVSCCDAAGQRTAERSLQPARSEGQHRFRVREEESRGYLVLPAATLGLPIAGLVSDKPLNEVIKHMADLNAAAHALGSDLAAPFMTLSFLSLSPIPELRLTDQGLIDAVHLKHTDLFV